MGPALSSISNCCFTKTDNDEEAILNVTNALVEAVENEDRDRHWAEVIRSVVDKCVDLSFVSNTGPKSLCLQSEPSENTGNLAESVGNKNICEHGPVNSTGSHVNLKRLGETPVSVPEKVIKKAEDEQTDLETEQSGSRNRNRKCKGEDEKGSKEKPKRPNYFIAVKISNPEIHGHLEKVQNHILEHDKRFSTCMIPLPTLHITLSVMHIANVEEHSRALLALNELYDEVKESMTLIPLELEFRGLGHFRNQVVYAKISPGDALARLEAFAKDIPKYFEKASVEITDKRGFAPHLTVMKLSRDPRIFRKGIKKIDPSLYSMYKDQLFGVQVVEGIQLLSMNGPKDAKGYYRGDELLFGLKECF